MVWPDTYNDEVVEINYNISDKKSWMKMSKILQDFLERMYPTPFINTSIENGQKKKFLFLSPLIQHTMIPDKHNATITTVPLASTSSKDHSPLRIIQSGPVPFTKAHWATVLELATQRLVITPPSHA